MLQSTPYSAKLQMQNQQRLPSFSSNDFTSASSEFSSEYSNDDMSSWQEQSMSSGEIFHLQSEEIKDTDLCKTATDKVVHVTLNTRLPHKKHGKLDFLTNMLGIISLRSGFQSYVDTKNLSIVVDALVPGGSAYKSGQVRLGDVLISIEDIFVDIKNVDEVLRSLVGRSKVKLCLKQESSVNSNKVNKNELSEVKVITPSTVSNFPEIKAPHAAMYVKHTENIDDDSEKEVLYKYYPKLANSEILFHIHGMYLTIFDIIRYSFKDNAFHSKLEVSGSTIYCLFNYNKKSNCLLVLCFPALYYSLEMSKKSTSDFVELLEAMYGSLYNAFSNPEHKLRIDYITKRFFLLNSNVYSLKLKKNIYSGVQMVKTTPEIDLNVRCLLSEFTSNDFTLDNSSLITKRRLFTVDSSCLFYRGYLLASQMSFDNLYKTQLFCFNHALSTFSKQQRVDLLVVWREIFPTSQKQKKHCFTNRLYTFDVKNKIRHFLLVVGLKNSLLCSIVRMSPYNNQNMPKPPSHIVDMAHSLLLQFHKKKIINQVKQAVNFQSPNIASADKHNKELKYNNIQPSFSRSLSQSSFKLPSFMKFSKNKYQNSKDDFINNRKSQNNKKTLFRNLSFSSQESLDDSTFTSIDIYKNNDRYVTFGEKNNLCCYIYANLASRVYTAPTIFQLEQFDSDLQNKVLTQFNLYSLLFKRKFLSNKSCEEQGIVFQVHHQSKYYKFNLVARIINEKLMILCFKNTSLKQNMFDMAFRLINQQEV